MPETPKTKPCPRCAGTKRFNKKACLYCKAKGVLETRPTFASVTHIAGRAYEVHDRVIQRCVTCGHKLIDLFVSKQPHDGRGKPAFWTWGEGDMVRLPNGHDQAESPTGKPALVGHTNSDPLPADYCVDLVEQG